MCPLQNLSSSSEISFLEMFGRNVFFKIHCKTNITNNMSNTYIRQTSKIYYVIKIKLTYNIDKARQSALQ